MDETKLRVLMTEMWKEMQAQFDRIETLEAQLVPVKVERSRRGVSYGTRKRHHPAIKPKRKKKKFKAKNTKDRAKSARRTGKSKANGISIGRGRGKKGVGYFSTRGEQPQDSADRYEQLRRPLTGRVARKTKTKKRKKRSNTVDNALISKIGRKKSGTTKGRLENLIAQDIKKRSSKKKIKQKNKSKSKSKTMKAKMKTKSQKKTSNMQFSSENPRLQRKRSPSRNKKKKIRTRRALSAQKALGYVDREEVDNEEETNESKRRKSSERAEEEEEEEEEEEVDLGSLGQKIRDHFLGRLSLRKSLLLSQVEEVGSESGGPIKEYGIDIWKRPIQKVLDNFSEQALEAYG